MDAIQYQVDYSTDLQPLKTLRSAQPPHIITSMTMNMRSVHDILLWPAERPVIIP
jgi:hypothetical protein